MHTSVAQLFVVIVIPIWYMWVLCSLLTTFTNVQNFPVKIGTWVSAAYSDSHLQEAEKPEGWLDNEPDQIDDPESTKPDDWDDEEDGEWEPPKIDNPKCEEAPGCGEWKRPTKKNPDYKGKWSAPLIDNPEYKGAWHPRKVRTGTHHEAVELILTWSFSLCSDLRSLPQSINQSIHAR